MLIRRQNHIATLGLAAVLAVCAGRAGAADPPSVERTLAVFHPSQKDVEYETPPPEDFKKCRINVERAGKMSGWVVYGPGGQVLRRFVDTNGDNVVDQWRYYNHGVEVYRDIDTNKNNKPDQCRWLNAGGSRWGIDSNEDGRIDSWKSLSPEEAVRQGVTALIRDDVHSLETVLATKEELRGLGISDSYSAKIADMVADAERKLRDVRARSKVLTNQTNFLRADNLTPAAVPAEEGKVADDLLVYENAMAIIENQQKTGLVQVGELVRVGDVWKLTQIPEPIEGTAAQVMAGGILMQPVVGSPATATPGGTAPSPEVQRILADLQKLDQGSPSPNAGREKLTEYNSKRADLLARLVAAATTDEERNQWMRQMIDSIASAVQIGAYTDGLSRLRSIEKDLRGNNEKSPLVPYVVYRRLLAEYTTQHQTSNASKQQESQKWWRGELEKFTKEFPDAEDTPEALLQLGIAEEFVGQIANARRWYGELADRHGKTKPGRRAAGALRRLELKGKPLDFAGPSLTDGRTISVQEYQGKVLLLVYWSTWCTSCNEDLPVIRALYDRFHPKGLEIVGVGLDMAAAPVRAYLAEHQVPWPQIFQAGGIESEPATALGIIVPPVMVLVDRQGKVAGVTTTTEDLKTAIPALIGDKKSE